jgi:hypothetical protein
VTEHSLKFAVGEEELDEGNVREPGCFSKEIMDFIKSLGRKLNLFKMNIALKELNGTPQMILDVYHEIISFASIVQGFRSGAIGSSLHWTVLLVPAADLLT